MKHKVLWIVLLLAGLLPLAGEAQLMIRENIRQSGCQPSFVAGGFKPRKTGIKIRPFVPKSALVREVLNLSDRDILTIYELGRRDANDVSTTDPDTRLLITRDGKAVFRYAIRDLPLPHGSDKTWGLSASIMSIANLCFDKGDVTYLVAQSGNQGGFFLALAGDGDGYRVIPVGPVTQGQLQLKRSAPATISVWTVAPEGSSECTACLKRFLVKKMVLEGKSFRVVESKRTKRTYRGFQNEPLKVSE